VRYIYNGANQIKCVDADSSGTCNGAEFLYLYDAYGNLTNDGTSTYVYDAENRLISTTAGSVISSYTYNGDGDRISQTVDSTLTTYVLDVATPLTMVLSETSNGSTIHYWQGLDVLTQSDGSQTEYLAYDGLGSVRQVTDSAGLVEMAQTFDPYGNLYSRSGVNSTTYGFTGEAQDTNGLLFLRARYYSAGMGRFLNTDPSRQEMNPFVYAIGNPVNLSDATGTLPCDGLADPELSSCLKSIEDKLWLYKVPSAQNYFPGYEFASNFMNYYLTGNGKTLNLGPEDFSDDLRKQVGEQVLSILQKDTTLALDLQNIFGTQLCAGELPLSIFGVQNLFYADYGFRVGFSPAPYVFSAGGESVAIPSGYYYAIGTGKLSNAGQSTVELTRYLFEPKKGFVTVNTPIELYDLYDWCYGRGARCEARDVQGLPGNEIFVGEFLALEKANRAAQFDWYAHWIVKTRFEVDGTSGTIKITDSKYEGYEKMQVPPINQTTPETRTLWDSPDFDDDWLCTQQSHDIPGCG